MSQFVNNPSNRTTIYTFGAVFGAMMVFSAISPTSFGFLQKAPIQNQDGSCPSNAKCCAACNLDWLKTILFALGLAAAGAGAFSKFGLQQDRNGELRGPGHLMVPMVLSSFLISGMATLVALLWQKAFGQLIEKPVVPVALVKSEWGDIAKNSHRKAVKRSFALASIMTVIGLLMALGLAKGINAVNRFEKSLQIK